MKRRLSVFIALLTLSVALPISPLPAAEAQTSPSIEVLHVVPYGVTPRFDDMQARIPETIRAVQEFLYADVGRTLRVKPGVTVVNVINGDDEPTRDQLVLAGFDDPNTIYLAFAESTGSGNACGRTLRDAVKPTYSFLWMPLCNGDDGIYPEAGTQTFPFGATYLVLHELIHALGAVEFCAPNEGNGGHVIDSPYDVIFLGVRDLDVWDNLTLDPGNDDYYGHNIIGCADIEDSAFWDDNGPPPPPPGPTPGALCTSTSITIDMTTGASGIGTAGDDVILGTEGNDLINGLGGDDIVCASGGNDTVVGGDGNDTLFGQGGADVLRGNTGADILQGGQGPDRLLGGTGDDEIAGGEGDDFIGGFGGHDVIDGGAGNDTVFGGFGSDTITGGLGNDVIRGLIGNDTIRGGGGDDVLDGDRGSDIIDGGAGNDVLRGGNANDVLKGQAGDDQVSGGKADDTLSGGPGNDVCVGNDQHFADTAGFDCETIFGVP